MLEMPVVMRHLPKRDVYREWFYSNQPERQKTYAAGSSRRAETVPSKTSKDEVLVTGH